MKLQTSQSLETSGSSIFAIRTEEIKNGKQQDGGQMKLKREIVLGQCKSTNCTICTGRLPLAAEVAGLAVPPPRRKAIPLGMLLIPPNHLQLGRQFLATDGITLQRQKEKEKAGRARAKADGAIVIVDNFFR